MNVNMVEFLGDCGGTSCGSLLIRSLSRSFFFPFSNAKGLVPCRRHPDGVGILIGQRRYKLILAFNN